MEIKAGMPVRSNAGHDKGHWYLVLSEEGTYAYLIDGQKRTPQRPKKKNKIHLQKSQSKLIASLYLQKITKKNHPNPKMKMI